MRKNLTVTRNFIYKHRAKIAVGVTSVVLIGIFSRGNNELNEFLRKHNLYEEFYGESE